jgi:very-short-patch-repair endonuclease
MGNPKLTKEKFQENILNLYGNKFKLINFESGQTKCTIKHIKCGNTFETFPNEFTRERVRKRFLEDLCPKCRRQSDISKSKKNVEDKLKLLTNGKLTLIGDFKNTHSKTTFKCNVCDKNFKAEPHILIRNVKTNKYPEKYFGCPYCSGKYQMSHEEFVNKINELDPSYKIIGKFTTMHTKVKSYHEKCKSEYMIYPENFIYKGERCPCEIDYNNSKNSIFIENLLNENKIKFTKEKSYDDLKGKKFKLRFDFYLEEYNLLIEYDGQQHFDKNSFSSGKINKFENTRKNDLVKNEYCQNNKINLLRIPYKLNLNEIKNLIKYIAEEEDVLAIINKYNMLFYDSEDDIMYNKNKYYEIYNYNK